MTATVPNDPVGEGERSKSEPVRVLHVYSGNLYGGIETFLRTLAKHGRPVRPDGFRALLRRAARKRASRDRREPAHAGRGSRPLATQRRRRPPPAPGTLRQGSTKSWSATPRGRMPSSLPRCASTGQASRITCTTCRTLAAGPIGWPIVRRPISFSATASSRRRTLDGSFRTPRGSSSGTRSTSISARPRVGRRFAQLSAPRPMRS